MTGKLLRGKEVRFTKEELHYMEVLKNTYKINPSEFIRNAFIEKLKNDIPEIRKDFKRKSNSIPF